MNTLGLEKQTVFETARPQEGGRIVNPHVLSSVVELKPDYSAIQRMLTKENTTEKMPEKTNVA